jgi:hypothetical protein
MIFLPRADGNVFSDCDLVQIPKYLNQLAQR